MNFIFDGEKEIFLLNLYATWNIELLSVFLSLPRLRHISPNILVLEYLLGYLREKGPDDVFSDVLEASKCVVITDEMYVEVGFKQIWKIQLNFRPSLYSST